MTRRFVFGLAAGLLALGLGSFETRAGLIPLPSSLATLEVAGNFADVANLRFSDFTYSVSPIATPPAAGGVTVNAFTSVPGEPGISFNGAFFAAANTIVDYAITYIVTTTDGSLISDAYLSLSGFANFGGDGRVAIGETIYDTVGNVISEVPFSVFTPGMTVDTTLLLPPQRTIVVHKDITVFGGSEGAVFSFANQGFSTTSVPEPGSMALLGIGLIGLLAARRRLRPASA
ncbi:PEP-CTERM sorting domain-containing protein [Paludisphaera mucosa]|uniref:PEP-CTERM sorting domain-containing protein n=1 Tax=Paludisphaera mucosa TaxID=3030827 RepID=A0ABT6FAU1_9BACT|nr:PEP-CTERM sorting domain-containing protein [Paludisphaera mucosa]MDG3004549.1 PEP-CTERM sorting domain-containing protein [Paludisphaera mucosa]